MQYQIGNTYLEWKTYIICNIIPNKQQNLNNLFFIFNSILFTYIQILSFCITKEYQHLFIYLFSCSTTVVPIFLCCSALPSYPPAHTGYPIVHAHRSFIHVPRHAPSLSTISNFFFINFLGKYISLHILWPDCKHIHSSLSSILFWGGD